MSQWLVTGARGMLGRALVDVLTLRGTQLTALAHADLDVADPIAVAKAVADHDVVINTAAWTDVDGAEANESAATAVNGVGAANLAMACAATGTRLLHISTDYVFSGEAELPYTEDDEPGPINAYGRSKLVGEQAVTRLAPGVGYVVRSAWLYGAHGRNFVSTVLRMAGEQEFLDVVDDQRGQPTWSQDLALHLALLGEAALAGSAPAGIYHATAAGDTTWYGLARAVFSEAGLDPDRVRPTTSEVFVRPAHRPRYSVLAHDRWSRVGLPPMAHWRDRLAAAYAAQESAFR
jgi:dTDP-4-dehydrorhamnose reductase